MDLAQIKQVANSPLYGKIRIVTDLIDSAKIGLSNLEN